PNALTCSATRRVSSILDRSPTATALACGTERRASFARTVLRACSVTSWPPSTSSRAAINPRPSEEPEMNTRDIGIPLRTRDRYYTHTKVNDGRPWIDLGQ